MARGYFAQKKWCKFQVSFLISSDKASGALSFLNIPAHQVEKENHLSSFISSLNLLDQKRISSEQLALWKLEMFIIHTHSGKKNWQRDVLVAVSKQQTPCAFCGSSGFGGFFSQSQDCPPPPQEKTYQVTERS